MAKKKSTPHDDESSTALSFEESLKELEAIVADLESGELGLSDALSRYEQGVTHLRVCQRMLDQAERKIEILSGLDADGNPITSPYNGIEDETLEGKASARGARRSSAKPSRGPQPPHDIDGLGRLF